MPVVREEVPRSKSNASFITHLLTSTTADDFVSVKVDIDHMPTELPIVHAIAARKEVSDLVDEFFFEYHFNFDNLTFGWDTHHGGRHQNELTVDDALGLMQTLRKKGVRSHWWI